MSVRGVSNLVSGELPAVREDDQPYVAVLQHIFSKLSPKDLCRAARVCRKWSVVAREEKITRAIASKGVDYLEVKRLAEGGRWKIIRAIELAKAVTPEKRDAAFLVIVQELARYGDFQFAEQLAETADGYIAIGQEYLRADQPEEAFRIAQCVTTPSPQLDQLFVLIVAQAVKSECLDLAEKAAAAITRVSKEKIEALALIGRSEEVKVAIESNDGVKDKLRLALVSGLRKRAKLVPSLSRELLGTAKTIAAEISDTNAREEAFLLTIQWLAELSLHDKSALFLFRLSPSGERKAKAHAYLGDSAYVKSVSSVVLASKGKLLDSIEAIKKLVTITDTQEVGADGQAILRRKTVIEGGEEGFAAVNEQLVCIRLELKSLDIGVAGKAIFTLIRDNWALDEAIKEINRLGRPSEKIQLLLVEGLIRKGDIDEAKATARMLTGAAKGEAVLCIIRTLISDGQLDEAKALIDEAGESALHQIQACVLLGERERAKRLAEEYPEDRLVRKIDCLVAAGSLKEAKEVAQKAGGLQGLAASLAITTQIPMAEAIPDLDSHTTEEEESASFSDKIVEYAVHGLVRENRLDEARAAVSHFSAQSMKQDALYRIAKKHIIKL